MFSSVFRRFHHQTILTYAFSSLSSMGEREGVIVNAPRSDLFKVSIKPVSHHCKEIWCSIRETLENSPKVGDNVIVEVADTRNGRIKKLLDRETEISYPPVANINQQLLVFSVEDDFDSHMTSRFLVEAESNGVEMRVVLTKTDLCTNQKRLESLLNKIEGWGYHPILTSTKNGKNMPELLSILHGKRTVLMGQSSAGKSTILKHVLMSCEERFAGFPEHKSMYLEHFDQGQSFLIDSIGFTQPRLEMITTIPELQRCFPELRLLPRKCKFRNCGHDGDMGCGLVNWNRRKIYLKLCEEIRAKGEENKHLTNRPGKKYGGKCKKDKYGGR